MGALLEVIVENAADATAAQEGGADRLELVRDRASDGRTPEPAVVREVLAATDLPVRVMVRGEGYTAGDVEALRREAVAVREAGAAEFVLGFLDGTGQVDVGTTRNLADELAGCPWTFHRAVDHALQYQLAWDHAVSLGPDAVLTAGSAEGVEEGLGTLRVLADQQDVEGVTLLVGGGLRPDHVDELLGMGVRAFHVGRAALDGAAVDAGRVREWRRRVDA
ncbi:copper homeostasis protein CutC [Saccharopolyspora sp. CA-218241]|uniref:copper homeostasis protein CutC n=1 Tax=Saccharopolyspora sp. CA-218241 TaxID=3240027 RepID=UPI003D96401C